MQIADLDQASSLAAQLRQIQRDVAAGQLGVSVTGSYQDDAMLAAITAAAKAELQGRMTKLGEQLQALGVDLTAAG